jgi:hypothetical protein
MSVWPARGGRERLSERTLGPTEDLSRNLKAFAGSSVEYTEVAENTSDTPNPTRLTVWRDVFWRPLGALVAVPYAILGLALLVRDEIIQPKDAARWKLLHLVSLVSVWQWVLIAFVVTLGVAMESAFRLLRRNAQEIARMNERLVPRMEVVPQHGSQYESWDHAESRKPYFEYHRIAVRNVGVEPIEDVRALACCVNGTDLRGGPIRLHEMHDNDRRSREPIRLQHNARAVFDVAKWDYGSVFALVDRDESLGVTLPVRETGLRLEIAISGDGVVTTPCFVLISGTVGKRPLRFSVIPSPPPTV